MEVKRKPFQGVMNIIRFNWHFYLIAGLIITTILFSANHLPPLIAPYVYWTALLAGIAILNSLLISVYVYDCSDLYQLEWLKGLDQKQLLTINAGFDETSGLVKNKFPGCTLTICDFYQPQKHTEVSIKRARKAYPPLVSSLPISTHKLPFEDNSFDAVLAILSAHEIRHDEERQLFFSELNRVIKPLGEIYVTEHLRDWKNLFAYSFGAFHFYSKTNWLRTFKSAQLNVKQELKATPFITTFILNKHGATL